MGNQTPNTKQLKKKEPTRFANLSILHPRQNWSANSPKTLSLIQTRGASRSQRTAKYSGCPRDAVILGKKRTLPVHSADHAHTPDKKKQLHSVFQHSPSVPKFCRKNLPLQEERIESSQRQREVKVGQYLGQRGAKCEKPPLRSSLEPSFCTNYTAGLCDTRN
ncbi:hypothetical protein IscW_ISCW013654 [Ixodes scapularis]|uniref:Uncharacterized protein n=1 Tax=Ixodes scapularis TaxID=6945 RepID=B7QK08_IXOSC|nr:hypothetical protein IscW_ISCW013654 [Ixodes scapularis]|eukprot:XP_002415515.1 hypothetical protein IscW_ISCW013654 [Ixodes scapularis]